MLHLKPLFHFTAQKRENTREFRCYIRFVVLSCCCCPSAGAESYSSFHSTLVPFLNHFLFIYFPVYISTESSIRRDRREICRFGTSPGGREKTPSRPPSQNPSENPSPEPSPKPSEILRTLKGFVAVRPPRRAP